MASLTRTRAKAPVGGWRLPHTYDPAMLVGYAGMAVANDAMYYRVRGSGVISKIAMIINVSSGNVSVAVLRGTPGLTTPGARIATSGTVACPAAGTQEISLGGSVAVNEGDWFGISVDNTTATFGRVGAAGAETGIGDGFVFRATGHHPIPASPASLIASIRFSFILIGRP
jgi:hypothetical protein